ncbi:MAG TPA: hypothetical protein VJH03_13850 [Blastocatellia bacterium]|nr:hypothetical protein [Blastocatellia bacterium]
MNRRILCGVVVTALIAGAAFAHQDDGRAPQAQTPPAQAQTPGPAQPAAPRPPEYVETTGFRGKVFTVKYREPRAVMDAVYQLGSGFKGARMSFSDEFKTITVRDFPENLIAIEEAIKRLDTPEAPRPDIELRIHMLVASNAEGAASSYPADLGPVVKQLQSTLNYKSYHLVSSIVQRVKDGVRNINGRGVAQIAPPIVKEPVDARYSFGTYSISITPAASGPATVELKRLVFEVNSSEYSAPLGQATITTDLGVRDGDKVVVGTASLKDKGLVLVVSATVIK